MQIIKNILVVEDSPLIVKILAGLIAQYENMQPLFAENFAQAQALLDAADEPFFAALVDLNLPDAPNGEIVDLCLSRHLPTVVLTGSYSETRRKELLSKGVMDYVLKESRFAYDAAVRLLGQLDKNRDTMVLIVDDSDTDRQYLHRLLSAYLFNVVQVDNARDALDILERAPAISLLITDHNMPGMSGLDLVRQVRKSSAKNDLTIIALSSEEDRQLPALFLKSGANDFLKKPYIREELYCRVMHNIEERELAERIKRAADIDYLTGLFNRRYFVQRAAQAMLDSQSSGEAVSLALLDLDGFRAINGRCGEAGGDALLKEFADALQRNFGMFTCCRYNGDVFAMLMPTLAVHSAVQVLNEFREYFGGTVQAWREWHLSLTFSAGVVELGQEAGEDVDAAIRTAERALLTAKHQGRNQVAAIADAA